jgi:hypothetical protein
MNSIFISYRRTDSPNATGRLQDALVEHFGAQRVFVDVTSLVDGVKYKDAIDAALRDCAVMLVVIGQRWLAMEDGAGHRKIDREDDIVRHELRTAFSRSIPVIPLLVDGAKLPTGAELPSDLRELPDRQARTLVYERWQSDVRDLIRAIERHNVPPAPDSAEIRAEEAAKRLREVEAVAARSTASAPRSKLHAFAGAAVLLALGAGGVWWYQGRSSAQETPLHSDPGPDPGPGPGPAPARADVTPSTAAELDPSDIIGTWYDDEGVALLVVKSGQEYKLELEAPEVQMEFHALGTIRGRELEFTGHIALAAQRRDVHGECMLANDGKLLLSARVAGNEDEVALAEALTRERPNVPARPPANAANASITGTWVDDEGTLSISQAPGGYVLAYTLHEMPITLQGTGTLSARTLTFEYTMNVYGEVVTLNGHVALSPSGDRLTGKVQSPDGSVEDIAYRRQ